MRKFKPLFTMFFFGYVIFLCGFYWNKSEIQKVMDIYRKDNPNCEACSLKPSFWGRNNEVHHKLPQHLYPKLAAEGTNFVSLCKSCHFLIGHCRNYHDFNMNTDETIKAMQEAYEKNAVSYLETLEKLGGGKNEAKRFTNQP